MKIFLSDSNEVDFLTWIIKYDFFGSGELCSIVAHNWQNQNEIKKFLIENYKIFVKQGEKKVTLELLIIDSIKNSKEAQLDYHCISAAGNFLTPTEKEVKSFLFEISNKIDLIEMEKNA